MDAGSGVKLLMCQSKHPTIGRDPDGTNVPQGEKDANENNGGEADDGTNVPPGLAKGEAVTDEARKALSTRDDAMVTLEQLSAASAEPIEHLRNTFWRAS